MATNNTNTCIKCSNTYNTKHKEEMYIKLSRATVHPLTIYNDTCLECSMNQLDVEANKCLLKLNKAVRKLRIFDRVYKKILNTKQKLSAQYGRLDHQHHYIKFFLREEAHAVANKTVTERKARAPRKNTSAKKQSDLIASLLASLTPEQRQLVAKQAANM